MVAAELVRLVKRMVAAATVAARRCTPVPVAAFSTSESVKLTLGWKKRTPNVHSWCQQQKQNRRTTLGDTVLSTLGSYNAQPMSRSRGISAEPPNVMASAACRQPRSLFSGSLRHLEFRVRGEVIAHDAGVFVPAKLDSTIIVAQLDVVLHPRVAPGYVLLLGWEKRTPGDQQQ